MRATFAGWSLGFAVLLSGTASAAEFSLSSSDIGPDKPLDDQFIFNAFGCAGGNVSPALSWSDAPGGTQSFVVAFFDPDAMRGRGFWHWLVLNIPATTTSLQRDAGSEDGSKLPPGAEQIKNGFRASGYSGSCPPPSDEPHAYVMTVYALKVPRIVVPAEATAGTIISTIDANALGRASITYRYGRKPVPPPVSE